MTMSAAADIARLLVALPQSEWPTLLRLFEGDVPDASGTKAAEPPMDRRDRLIREFRRDALAHIASDRAAAREIEKLLNRAAAGNRTARGLVGEVLNLNGSETLGASRIRTILGGSLTPTKVAFAKSQQQADDSAVRCNDGIRQEKDRRAC
jgi:hypothetical protein